jgi:hypothetical protein
MALQRVGLRFDIAETEPEEFFYEHAGTSYYPATETEEGGRRRGAAQLAMAERFAAALGLTYTWRDDWGLNTSHAEEYCADAYPDGEPETCEWLLMYDATGREVGALGCIDDADDNYRRVCEAEMALEYLRGGYAQ